MLVGHVIFGRTDERKQTGSTLVRCRAAALTGGDQRRRQAYQFNEKVATLTGEVMDSALLFSACMVIVCFFRVTLLAVWWYPEAMLKNMPRKRAWSNDFSSLVCDTRARSRKWRGLGVPTGQNERQRAAAPMSLASPSVTCTPVPMTACVLSTCTATLKQLSSTNVDTKDPCSSPEDIRTRRGGGSREGGGKEKTGDRGPDKFKFETPCSNKIQVPPNQKFQKIEFRFKKKQAVSCTLGRRVVHTYLCGCMSGAATDAASDAANEAANEGAGRRALNFAAYGLTGGFEGLNEHRLRRALPSHLEQGHVALLYGDLPARSPLRNVLRRMTLLGDPRLLKPRDVVVARDRESGVYFCVSPYNPAKSGFRFQWQKPPARAHAKHPEGNPPPERVPGEGFEEAGKYFTYAYLQQFCADGTLEDFPVYDKASLAPQVFYRAVDFSRADRVAVDALQALMLAHAEHKLTVVATHVTPVQPFTRFAQCSLQHHVCRNRVPHVRVLPPLFTSKSHGGTRARHELTLRTRVLLPHTLRTSNVRAQRHRALTAVGDHVCAQQWNEHASADPVCLAAVLSRKRSRRPVPSRHVDNTPAGKTTGGSRTQQTLLSYRKESAAARPVQPTDPILWEQLEFRQRSAAISAMATPALLDWRSKGPKLPDAMVWRDAHHRGQVRQCCWDALNVPQVHNCLDAGAWAEEVRADRYNFSASPKLLVTNTLPDDWFCFDGVLYCGDGGLTVDADGRACFVHWAEETITHAEHTDGARRKQRDVYVRVDWTRVDADTFQRAAPEKSAARVTKTPIVCVPRAEMPWITLYVQWFPMLCDHDWVVKETPLHPHMVACLDELQDRCYQWISVCDERIAADAKERGGMRRTLTQHKEYFEELLRRYQALYEFRYEGCNVGTEQYTGPWFEV